VAREILPHEARIRAWLGRSRLPPEDIDEVVQEAYCRIAMLDTFEHIDSPRAYFFSITRNLLLRRLKRGRIVSFETISQVEECHDLTTPSPEEQMAIRLACNRVLEMIAALPERCRRIVELRKIEGWSQKEIATHLGISEKAVEKQVWLGVKTVRDSWRRLQEPGDARPARKVRGER